MANDVTSESPVNVPVEIDAETAVRTILFASTRDPLLHQTVRPVADAMVSRDCSIGYTWSNYRGSVSS